jgi:hypothetical protein
MTVRDPQPMDAGFEQTMLDADALSKFLVLAPGCDGRQRGNSCREVRTRAVPDPVWDVPLLLSRAVVLRTAVQDRCADRVEAASAGPPPSVSRGPARSP